MNKLTTFSSDEGNNSEVMESLQIHLDNTKIKKGFFEILNGGWQMKSEMTLPFEVSAEKVQHKLGRLLGGEVDCYNEDGRLKFSQSGGVGSNNEMAILHDMMEYDVVKKKVWK